MNNSLVKDIDDILEDDRRYFGDKGAGVMPISKSSGRILLAQRSLRVTQPGTWGVWGGRLEEGEDPKRGAKRELKEEAGYQGRLSIRHLHTYHDDESGFQYMTYVGLAPEEFEPRLNWENSGYKWMSFDEFMGLSNLHFGLEEVRSRQRREIKGIIEQLNGE